MQHCMLNSVYLVVLFTMLVNNAIHCLINSLLETLQVSVNLRYYKNRMIRSNDVRRRL